MKNFVSTTPSDDRHVSGSNGVTDSASSHPMLCRSNSFEERLTREEIVFLQSVKDGNVEDVRRLLQGSVNISVDCYDFRGQQALEIAVGQHDELMVRELLALCPFGTLHLYNATLKAVTEQDLDLLAMLLDSNQMIGCVAGTSVTTGKKKKTRIDFVHGTVTDRDGSQIRLSMTPIMAAILNGNVEIAQFLRERKHYVPTPETCREGAMIFYDRHAQGSSITQYKFQLNAYRTLCHPLYIALTEADPILRSFQLSHDMHNLANELPEYESDFSPLVTQCGQFAVDLLSHCRDTSEVEKILSQRKGLQDPRSHEFSRLHLAIHLKQKEFVVHPYCQEVLRCIWVQGLDSWYTWSAQKRIIYVLLHSLLTPFVVVCYLLLPTASVFRPLRVPLNRMIYATASYFFFLLLLLILLYQPRSEIKSPSTWTEVGIAIYALGYFWEVIVNIYSLGLETFFRSWWCVYDLILFTTFMVTQMLWFSSALPILMDENTRSTPRSNWPYYHPFLISECLFSYAAIMAFARLLIYYNLHRRIGPLSISLKRMCVTVFRFLLIFFLIMFSFAVGLNSIYKNYKTVHLRSEEDIEIKPSNTELVSLSKTFKNLFWAIFGMVEANYADISLTVIQLVTIENGTRVINITNPRHHITEFTGYTIWGVYHVITVIVLLNMFIAMMTDAYKRVQKNADLEWKFGRSCVWMNFLKGHSTVPPPFNLLPSLHGIQKFVQAIISLFKGTHRKRRIIQDLCWKERCCYGENVDEDIADQKQRDEEYCILMQRLVRSYLRSRELEGSQRSNAVCALTPESIQRLKTEVLRDVRRSLQEDGMNSCNRRSAPDLFTNPNVTPKTGRSRSTNARSRSTSDYSNL